MKLFSKTVYHGSGANFDKFDLSFMSTGEGAQVHGWGVYLTESKDTAQSYRDKLEGKDGPFILDFDDGTSISVSKEEAHQEDVSKIKPKLYELGWQDTPNDKMISFLYKFRNIEDYIERMTRMIWKIGDEQRKPFEDNLQIIKDHVSIGHEKTGMILTVEIPEDWVFAEEDAEIENQPEAVKNVLNEIYDFSQDISVIEFPSTSKNSIRTLISKYTNNRYALEQYDVIMDTIEEWDYDDWDLTVENLIPKMDLIFQANCALDLDEDVLRKFSEALLKYADNYKVTKQKSITFGEWYDDGSDVFDDGAEGLSTELYNRGVHGIHYIGEIDGSCYVIFNPEGLIIKEKE